MIRGERRLGNSFVLGIVSMLETVKGFSFSP
jgi:hypothetical protein